MRTYILNVTGITMGRRLAADGHGVQSLGSRDTNIEREAWRESLEFAAVSLVDLRQLPHKSTGINPPAS